MSDRDVTECGRHWTYDTDPMAGLRHDCTLPVGHEPPHVCDCGCEEWR